MLAPPSHGGVFLVPDGLSCYARYVSPVLPSDIEPLIGSESDTFCERLIAMIKLSYLVYKFVKWIVNETGTDFSDSFKAVLCAILSDCPEE